MELLILQLRVPQVMLLFLLVLIFQMLLLVIKVQFFRCSLYLQEVLQLLGILEQHHKVEVKDLHYAVMLFVHKCELSKM